MNEGHELYLGRQWVMWNQPRQGSAWDRCTSYHALPEGVVLEPPEGGFYVVAEDMRGIFPACGYTGSGGYRHIAVDDPRRSDGSPGNVCGRCVRILEGKAGR